MPYEARPNLYTYVAIVSNQNVGLTSQVLNEIRLKNNIMFDFVRGKRNQSYLELILKLSQEFLNVRFRDDFNQNYELLDGKKNKINNLKN